jgi:hypothetical protein
VNAARKAAVREKIRKIKSKHFFYVGNSSLLCPRNHSAAAEKGLCNRYKPSLEEKQGFGYPPKLSLEKKQGFGHPPRPSLEENEVSVTHRKPPRE